MKFRLGEDKLTFAHIKKYLSDELEIELTPSRRKHLEKVRSFVESKIHSTDTYYGINTGFGRLASEKIPAGELKQLQVNLIRSHACGVGEPFSNDIVRMMMLLRANVLAMGYSGSSLPVLDLLMKMIAKKIIPIVPSKGSVGASGDLAPLAHLALAMIGEGEVHYNSKKMSASSALKSAGLKPVELQAKDGLTLINGTQAMTAIASIALINIESLIERSDEAAALTVEGMRGSLRPFESEIHEVRGQKGQIESAHAIRHLLKNSKNIRSHKHCSRVQDAYSLRCVPQVHGAVRDAYNFAYDIIARELNACTDNPLVFPDMDRIVSGGNFHGEVIAFAMDMMAIAISELGSISERRIEQMTNPKSHDLPVLFLTPHPGINSGFMIPHVVASALASENKTLAHPASVDSIPTSAGQEDHVSMGMWAAMKLLKIIDNVRYIIVIELMAASQACDLREEKFPLGEGTERVYEFVRKHVKFIDQDRYIAPEMESLFASLSAQ